MKPNDDMIELSGEIESSSDRHIKERLSISLADADGKTNLETPQRDMLFSIGKYMVYSHEAHRRGI